MDKDDAETLGRYSKRIPMTPNDVIHGPSATDLDGTDHPATSDEQNVADVVGNRYGVTALDVSGERRYLSQHWADGTTCELTGNPRSVEIQASIERVIKRGFDPRTDYTYAWR